MNHLEKLLSGQKVEWKPLGEVAEVSAGNSAPQNQDLFLGGIYPFCRTSDVGRVHHSVDFSDIQDKLNQNGIKGLRLFPKETILLPKSGASTLLNHRVMLSVDSYVSSHLATIYRKEELILAKYLFYFLSGFDISQLIPDKSYPSLKVSEIAKILIPIPPLSVQKEIVRILDAFTALSSELSHALKNELNLRQKQYQYYRDLLLSEDELAKVGFEWKRLGEVAEIGTGSSNRQDESEDGEYPFYVRSKNILRSNGYQFDETAIIIPGEGGIGDIFHYVQGKYSLHQRAYRICVHDEALEPKYLFYVAHKNFKQYILSKSVGATATSIRKPMLEKFKIPVPPLEHQAKIVAILDKFEALCQSISEGLPREMELRRKQYEYYRGQLLNFPREED